MVYFGEFRNGKIVPERELRLPEGSRVRIEPVADTPVIPEGVDPIDMLGEDATPLPDLPTDLSAEHDHYLYGTPRRGPSPGSNEA